MAQNPHEIGGLDPWILSPYPSGMFRRVLGRAASAVDRAATYAVYAQSSRARARGRAERLGHDERLEALARIAELYPPSAKDTFFRAAGVIAPHAREVSSTSALRVVDLSWPSPVETFLPAMQERWQRLTGSHHTHARLHLHPERRPALILVHGYLGGAFWLEERSWPTAWLRRTGLDLAFIVLPAHGPRRDPGHLGAPRFPSADPRMTLELFRQTIGEIADLTAWLRAQGHPRVGIMGMSLGGYTTALAATAVAGLDFAIPVIPLVSIADFARDQGRLGSTPEETTLQHAALDRAHTLVSPLTRPSLLPGRVRIIAGEADRITPIDHAKRMARHFDAPLETWPGGHLFQIGRRDAFRGIGRALRDWGVT